MPSDEVSHGDIYHKLGALEGKLDAVILSDSQKRSDISEAFRRLGDVEKRVAQGAILTVAIAVIAPLIWQAVDPSVHLNPMPESHERK
jgi:hypothetical protein